LQDPNSLSLAARRALAQENKKHLLLVIDQFEEVFTQCRQDDERRAFIENLLRAVDPANPQPISILLTLRADFYTQLAFQDHLRELVSQNQEFIGAMSRDELTRAILQPAALGNWKVQEGLVEVILDDLGSEPGALPLLSHALLETWKRRRGRVLTVSGYTAAGGVRGAIAQTAETVFRQRLSAEQQPIARMIFIKLAEMGEDSLDTRRRAAFSELITRSTDTSTIDAVLSILTDARLVTTGTLEPGDTRVVEVAHEALIREWPTLRDWLNQNREGLILHRQLTEDTNDWIKLGRDSGALYRGARLKQTLEWVKSNADLISLAEQEFLDASQKTARKEAGLTERLARARWVQALLAVIVIVIILGVNGAFARHVMPDGVFNIAVAEFGEMDANGEIHSSKAGQLMSGWTVNYLRDELKKEDSNLVVWPNEGNLFTRTNVPLVKPDTAEKTAADINADLLLYGYIDTRANPPQLALNFWIAPQDKYKFEDIQGSTQIGNPIRVVNLNDPGISVQGELERQSISAAFIAMGLAQEQLGQTEDALAVFLKAERAAPQSEIVQFFVGREYLFWAEFQPDQQAALWQKAEDSYLKAIEFNDQYAKAYLGLGSVYIKRSAELLDTAKASNLTIDPQSLQLAEQAILSYQKALELKPGPEQIGNVDKDLARLALGNAYRQKGAILLYQGNTDLALSAFDAAIESLGLAQTAFEASTPEHESYRRYLAQTYEYLGTVYQWQGSAFEIKQDYEQALPAYQKAMDAFSRCVAQDEASDDLIIQIDIVEKYCQPKFEEIKQRYDELIGGN
jgi:tetratricopeptide (TPR) repeat protein